MKHTNMQTAMLAVSDLPLQKMPLGEQPVSQGWGDSLRVWQTIPRKADLGEPTQLQFWLRKVMV